MINFIQLLNSFKHALRGIKVIIINEQSFRIQLAVAFFVIIISFVFPISSNQRIIVFLLIGAVLSLELINSIFERIVDTFKPRIHPVVRDIKDIMAAAVLIVSVSSLIIGLTIFLPHFKNLF